MIDLTKTRLPSAIDVGGSLYYLHTDFQYWINFAIQIENKKTVNVLDFDFLYSAEKPTDRISAYKELLKFAFPKKELPHPVRSSNVRMLDYVLDADLIYSAFKQQYNIDLLDENLHLHWYKFQALLSGLRETKLTDVMGYRGYDENDKSDFKKNMIEQRKAWELPAIIDEQTQSDLDAFNALFEKK